VESAGGGGLPAVAKKEEEADQGFAFLDLSRAERHEGRDLREGYRFEGEHFVGRGLVVDAVAIVGAEDGEPFICIARTRVIGDELGHPIRGEPRFLEQLPTRGVDSRLVWLDGAGGNAKEGRVDGVVVLPNEKDVAISRNGHDSHSARMLDNFANGPPTGGKENIVNAHTEALAGETRSGGEGLIAAGVNGSGRCRVG
jgi:hypothetical protein